MLKLNGHIFHDAYMFVWFIWSRILNNM